MPGGGRDVGKGKEGLDKGTKRRSSSSGEACGPWLPPAWVPVLVLPPLGYGLWVGHLPSLLLHFPISILSIINNT